MEDQSNEEIVVVDEEEEKDEISITIIFPNRHRLSIPSFSKNLKVKILSSRIKQESSQQDLEFIKGKYLRLIFNGKLLNEELTLKNYGIEDGVSIHCNLSEFPSRNHLRNAIQSGYTNETIVVGEDFNRPNNGPNNDYSDVISGEELHGFDRMREQGFSNVEIEHFRNQFYSTRQYLITQRNNGQITTGELHRLEEQWMNSTDPIEGTQNNIGDHFRVDDDAAAVYHVTSEGTNMEMFYGVLLGFLFGVLNILFLCFNFGVSRKFKYGILFGISVNISLTLFSIFLPW